MRSVQDICIKYTSLLNTSCILFNYKSKGRSKQNQVSGQTITIKQLRMKAIFIFLQCVDHKRLQNESLKVFSCVTFCIWFIKEKGELNNTPHKLLSLNPIVNMFKSFWIFTLNFLYISPGNQFYKHSVELSEFLHSVGIQTIYPKAFQIRDAQHSFLLNWQLIAKWCCCWSWYIFYWNYWHLTQDGSTMKVDSVLSAL